jgi:hypothetical protein
MPWGEEMARAFKFLAIADDTPECAPAVLFAGLRAKATNSKAIVLTVIEPSAQADWISVGQEIRRQSLESAHALAHGLAARVAAETGETPELIFREGNLQKEISRLIDEDPDIGILVLGAAARRGGPGPMVTALARGRRFATRPLPVVVVPATMTIEDLRMLL